jgi:hypothetical protein
MLLALSLAKIVKEGWRMVKRIDTEQVLEQSRSITAEDDRELLHRELLSSGEQLRSVLAGLNKHDCHSAQAGEARHV